MAKQTSQGMTLKVGSSIARTTTVLTDTGCDMISVNGPFGNRTIGPRTVIVPADPIIWDESTSYEYLTLVASDDFGQSYVSKKDVPAGTPLTNTEYWIPAAQFNAQLSAINSSLSEINKNIGLIKGGIVTPEMYGAVGDGITNDTEAVQNAISNGSLIVGSEGSVYLIDNVNVGDYKTLVSMRVKSSTVAFNVQSRHAEFISLKVECTNSSEPTSDGTTYGFNITRPVDNTNAFVRFIGCEVDRFNRGINANAQAGFSCTACTFRENHIAIFTLATDVKLTQIVTQGNIGIVSQPGLTANDWHHWCWTNDYQDSAMLIPYSYGVYHLNNCTADSVKSTVRMDYSDAYNSVIAFDGLQYYLNPSVVNGNNYSAPVMCDNYENVRILLNTATLQLTADDTPVNYVPYDNDNVFIGNIVAYGSQNNEHNSSGIQNGTIGDETYVTVQNNKFIRTGQFYIAFINGIVKTPIAPNTVVEIADISYLNGGIPCAVQFTDGDTTYGYTGFTNANNKLCVKVLDNITSGSFRASLVKLNMS